MTLQQALHRGERGTSVAAAKVVPAKPESKNGVGITVIFVMPEGNKCGRLLIYTKTKMKPVIVESGLKSGRPKNSLFKLSVFEVSVF